MPTYQFYCETCANQMEEFHSMKNCPDFISCDKCGQPAKKQIAGNEAFHLKGTCWARDKYTGGGNLKWTKSED